MEEDGTERRDSWRTPGNRMLAVLQGILSAALNMLRVCLLDDVRVAATQHGRDDGDLLHHVRG